MNTWLKFNRLISDPILTATVITNNADGTSVCTTPGGNTIVIKGTFVSPPGRCFYKRDEMIGEAPALTALTIEV